MRRGLLATLVLLGAVGVASADYVVIVAHLNPNNQQGGGVGGAGMVGGGPGMVGGGPGMIGGGPGMIGGRPGMAGPGMVGGGPGMIGGRPGMAGPGMIGGGPAGGGAGMIGGGFAGLPPPAPPTDADDAANLVVVVVEVHGPVGGYIKTFKLAGKPVRFRHAFGGSAMLQRRWPGGTYIVEILENTAGRPVPSVSDRFKQMYDDTMKGKPSAEDVLVVAKYALEYGLLDRNKVTLLPGYVEIMEKLAETEKTNTAVAAYLKVKADLAKPLPGDEVFVGWKDKLLINYKITQDDKHHFALMHSTDMSDVDVRRALARLEKSFRSYFYWWAMRGINLPMPTERLLALCTEKGEDFGKLRKQLTASPVLADSFFARREGTSIFAAKRTDEPYVGLDNVSQPFWEKGFNRELILKGTSKVGYPRTIPSTNPVVHETRLVALILKALETEWEKTNTSHEASRQLLFATGLLPAKVQVPEWIQFGMGSLFEIPLQAPWGGVGAPSPYWLPRFLEYKYEPTPRETLLKVIGDGYFRGQSPLGPKATPEERHQRAAELRKGRAASWALTFFLAKDNLDGLQRYFKELSRMPRDVALDDKVLIAAFARAFDCVDAGKKIDNGKLGQIAGRWMAFAKTQSIEGASIHKKIREYYTLMNKLRAPAQGGVGPGVPPPPGGNP